VQLGGQADHVHQQGQEQLVVGDVAALVPAQVAGQVEGDQAHQHFKHVDHRQLDAEAPADRGDGRDLPDHGDPAQLDQVPHVLVAGRAADIALHELP
jgi:hypothetical protein